MPRPKRSGPVAEANRPVAALEAQGLFQALEAHQHVALAISGGGDSTALMWLAAHWAKSLQNPPRLSVLTVDHGFRAASAGEAEQVVAWAEALGLSGYILTADTGKPSSGLQNKARELRYRLLARWCREAGASALVTAHTREDQAETFLMRLARGSGIQGLSGMPAHGVTSDGVPIERPFLDIERARLRATLTVAGHSWIEDPSNEDVHFERVRMRKHGVKLAEIGLTAAVLARSAGRLARAAQPLVRQSSALLEAAVDLKPQGYALIDLGKFRSEEAEIRILALQQLLKMMGGALEPPRLMAVERLDAWIGSGAGQARTLAGCRIARRSKSLVIGREPGRIAAGPVDLPHGGPVIWDKRFMVEWDKSPAGSVILPAGLVSGRSRDDSLPAFIRDGLPAIVAEGRLVGLPYSAQVPAGLHCRFLGSDLESRTV